MQAATSSFTGQGTFEHVFPISPYTPPGAVTLQLFVADSGSACGFAATSAYSVTMW